MCNNIKNNFFLKGSCFIGLEFGLIVKEMWRKI